ncbi:uncharacterized protein LOC129758813 [Uranotaenia lowii]|uniref:uncharacterized protein LOC129758813 n=1 Tax=Uranotaenia lowii TaxID=190385 RepID=UPI002479ABB5|nr:uncharacterized protein LOC129758813 [Uranotaenia lowii]XP_055612419.1 uncharacterized protein LOC129758813 [Uranotaenia lowii]XP_055612420.1 uncharacterized protein LOC129758813 [Uranotaenia lowii]XP_055612421.1 uncharacterized protein LOC129758813 [Uranotaenia lowii]
MARLLVLLLCISMTTTQKPSSFNFKEKDVDPQLQEIQRQNQITQKILQRYLERRLHPNRKPQIRVPSVDEILAKSLASGSIRDTRQQNQTLLSGGGGGQSSNSFLKGSAGSRYSLFSDYNSRQYDRDLEGEDGLDGEQQEQGDRSRQQDDYDMMSDQDLDQYDDLGASLDNDHIDIESLQSGESEHVDSFYREKAYRQRASQLSEDYGTLLRRTALDEDFVDDPEVSILSEITNEVRRLTAAEKNSGKGRESSDLADQIRPTKTIRAKRQAINNRTNRRSRITQRNEPSITNRIDSRYYLSDDYIDYVTTPRLSNNLRDNYDNYRLLSKSRVSVNDIRTTRPRTQTQSTLNRNTARSRNTLKSLAYKPNNYNANTRRPSFTLSATYGLNNKTPTRSNGRRRANTRGSYQKEEDQRVNRFGYTSAREDWRKKTVTLGSSSIQPSTPALTVTFHLPTDSTVSVIANSKTEISLIKTTTTSIEEICTSCFSLTQGPNGQPVNVLNKEITSFNRDGLVEVTKFILSSTPTTTISVSQNTFRGRSTAYSATITTTIYEATPFVQTKGNNQNSAVLSNAPLANILLSQLLLGNLGVGAEPNFAPIKTEFIQDPNRYSVILTTTTELKTQVKEVVTTVTQTKSIVLPVTFQGREILTTIYDTDVAPTVLTSYITETLTVPTVSTIRIQQSTDDLSNKLSLLLPLLEERQRQNQLLSAAAIAAEPVPVLPIVSTAPPSASSILSSASVSKVYVSGQHPGEFSVSFTTILNS